MLTDEDISERNGQLIEFITALDMGIHIIDLPHKPKLISRDYTTQYCAYVKNFHLILTKGQDDEVYLNIRLKPLRNMDVDELKSKILHWIVIYQHHRIYTLTLANTGLFIVGFNHHNKILKKNPYPVFAKYDPITYFSLEYAENTRDKFNEFELIIK